jgi:hypothetical protein
VVVNRSSTQPDVQAGGQPPAGQTNVLLWCGPAVAQDSSNGDRGPAAEAAYRRGNVRIDGLIEEGAWQDATPVTEFVEGTAVVDGDNVSCAGGRVCEGDGERYIDWDGDGIADISFEDGDFNIRSLRLNAVLRWEYRPGSTIFLVWQQNRRDRINDGSFDLGRDIDALGSLDSENVFILKVNYWLGL